MSVNVTLQFTLSSLSRKAFPQITKLCSLPEKSLVCFKRDLSSSSERDRKRVCDTSGDVTFEHLHGQRKGITVMSLGRLRYKNAMGKKFLIQISEAVEELKNNKDIRCLVIRSKVPGVFCAGADLKERLQMTDKEVGEFVATHIRENITRLENLPMPSIAAVDGAALGGGLELALGCDLRVASTSAKLGLVETSLAIFPGGGGTQRLSRTIGIAAAKELIYTSRVLDGRQAKEYGLVNHCVEQNPSGDAAYLRAVELAEEILPNGPIGVRLAKAAISKGYEVDLESGLKFEEAYYAQTIPTKDRIEALTAFKEKRKPKFEGH